MGLLEQRQLLEQRKSELNKINNPAPSKMNLHSGLMSRIKRQQDRNFMNEILRQRKDTDKKLVRINQLIEQPEIFSAQDNEDFSILQNPKRLRTKAGWFLR